MRQARQLRTLLRSFAENIDAARICEPYVYRAELLEVLFQFFRPACLPVLLHVLLYCNSNGTKQNDKGKRKMLSGRKC